MVYDVLFWIGVAAALVSVVDRAAFHRLPKRVSLALYLFFLAVVAVRLLRD